MYPRLYVTIQQDPNAFGDSTTTFPDRIVAMAKQNTEQAELLRILLQDGWSIDHDQTTADSIVFHAERDFATPIAAINAARICGALNHQLDWYDEQGAVTGMSTRLPERAPQVGDRYVLTEDVERFPHFIARRGMVGTLTAVNDLHIDLTLDEPLPGAEEWDNALIFTAGDAPPPGTSALDALKASAVQVLVDAP